MNVSIYKLYDPRDTTQSPRYIGITSKSLKTRLSSHLNTHQLSKKSTHKINWIKGLLKDGVSPQIELIEFLDSWEKGCEREIFWIKYFRDNGFNLTNLTDGGEGIPGLKRPQHVIDIIRKTHTGLKHSEETKKKMSIADTGRVVSKETRDKISKSTKGKKLSTEHCTKLKKLFGKHVIVKFFDSSIMEFESIRDCAKYLNTNVDAVRYNIINNKYEKLKCMIKFKNDEQRLL